MKWITYDLIGGSASVFVVHVRLSDPSVSPYGQPHLAKYVLGCFLASSDWKRLVGCKVPLTIIVSLNGIEKQNFWQFPLLLRQGFDWSMYCELLLNTLIPYRRLPVDFQKKNRIRIRIKNLEKCTFSQACLPSSIDLIIFSFEPSTLFMLRIASIRQSVTNSSSPWITNENGCLILGDVIVCTSLPSKLEYCIWSSSASHQYSLSVR